MTCHIRDLHVWSGADFGPEFRRETPVERLIVTSSAEIDVMGEPQARAMLAAASPPGFAGPQSLVSVGCAGVYAAVLEFLASGAASARILALEAPRAYVQRRLDAAGLGPDGAGFVAQEAACVMDLTREPEGLALPISHCEILARPAHMGGTAALAGEAARRIAQLSAEIPGLSVVEFENVSDWARGLGALVRRALAGHPTADPSRWAPSFERDERHFMTVRPLLDLNRLRGAEPLLVGCLGAGGRLGLMVVGEARGEAAIRRPWPLSERRAMEPPRLNPAEAALAPPAYMDRRFFGRSNFYFHWTLEQDAHAPA